MSPSLSRRHFLYLSGAAAVAAHQAPGQGVVQRKVAPAPRGKASGLPFRARFTDVAAQAGLTEPVIYGGVYSKSYIVETIGCGVAFLDYDNDGWLDIFLLSGTRLEGSVSGATNRLYKNNRDGTFVDVTEKAGLHKQVGPLPSRSPTIAMMASTTCSSPTLARTCCTETTATAPLPM